MSTMGLVASGIRGRLGAGLLAAVVAVLLLETGAVHPLELISLDARFALRSSEPNAAKRVAIVAIDNPTLAAIGRYPVPRDYYARALDRLHADGARRVAIDVQFTKPSTIAEDNALISGLRRNPEAVLVTAAASPRGVNDVLGGVSARRYARVQVASALLPLSDAATYRQFALREEGLLTLPAQIDEDINGPAAIARLGRPPIWIDYAGGPGTIPTYSLRALLSGRVAPERLRGKVVLIGFTAPSVGDDHSYSALASREMSGVEIEANAAATALAGAPLRGLSGWLAALVAIALAVPAPVLASRRRWWQALLIVAAGGLLILVCAQLLFDAGTLVPVTAPLFALVIAGAVAVGESLLSEIRTRAVEAGAARQRALDAADAARHRVERDLHDGAQQRLLALAMTLSAPGAQANRELLDSSVSEIRRTLTELRALTRGANPAALEELGLAGALRSLADASPVPATLRLDRVDGLPPAGARALYLIAAEALSNVIKHSGATVVLIEASRQAHEVTLTVSDDGRGGASPQGSGLRGLTERAELLHGSVAIISPSGGGTTITAVLPC